MSLHDSITLLPAYGRSYSTIMQVEQAWHKGADFQMGVGGPYCSIRDMIALKREYYAIYLASPLPNNVITRVA